MSRSTRERWAELVKVALVGTGRQALGEPAVEVPGATAEARLLGEAAALALHERAGALPPVLEAAPPAEAPRENLPRASTVATRELEIALVAEPALVPEWLRLCAPGRRADERMLADLLEFARADVDLRPAVIAVLGERGRWLAGQNPGWGWVAAGAPAPDAWEHGGRAQRLGFFASLRKRDPEAARALIEPGFAKETPEDRAELVQRFAVGLSAADEPFLEAALDDRRKEVRLAAARVLACLPTSRLGARMAARAKPLVRGGHVKLPEMPDAAGQRDGLELTPPRGEGPRAFYLRQLLAATPLATWGAPGPALAAVGKSEWREVVVLGWALAAARQRDAAWAEALLGVTLQVPELLGIVAPARREAVALAALSRADTADIPLILRQLDKPFGEKLSRAALTAVRLGCLGEDADRAPSGSNRARAQAARALLAEIAVDVAPSLLEPLVASLTPPKPTLWHAVLSAVIPLVERRLAIHRAFQEPA